MFCFVLTSPPLMLCVYLQTFEAALFWKKKRRRKTMYNVIIDNVLNNYIANIIDYILCPSTTHIQWNQVTITQTVSPFSYTTYIHNFDIACYIMIVEVI